MKHVQCQNSAVDDIGIIFNWNISTNFDKKGECLINFELPYSANNPTIKVEPQNKCVVFNVTNTSFKVKRKSKRLKEIKWIAVGY